MNSTDYLIIGAGIAGLSTAYHLGQTGNSSVVIVEKEDHPGAHASTKNSGMIHHFHPDREMREHIARGVRRLKEYDASKEESFFTPSSSLFLFPEEQVRELEQDPEPYGGRERLSFDEVPASLKPEQLPSGSAFIRFAEDGLIEPDRYLNVLRVDLTRMDIPLHLSEAVQTAKQEKDEWIVETSQTTYRVKNVINASGAWAERLGKILGASEKGLDPYRRHLYITEENLLPGEFGFYWDDVNDIYFRHYEDRTLLSDCDNHDVPPGEKPDIAHPPDLIRESLSTTYPQFRDISVEEYWSCHRTRGPERVPYICSDDEREGLHWVGGLEGHGITASMWIGKRAADVITLSE